MTKLTLVRLVVIGAVVLGLGGCAALGGGKKPPDEFAITTRAPLVVPPEYALLPPKPGESRPQELSASERAQQVLLGDTSAAPPSDGEILILQKSGAVRADRNIAIFFLRKMAGVVKKRPDWPIN